MAFSEDYKIYFIYGPRWFLPYKLYSKSKSEPWKQMNLQLHQKPLWDYPGKGNKAQVTFLVHKRLTSGYLAASPPEKLNVTSCVTQHTKGMRDINYSWQYFWNCPWGHLSGLFESLWFPEVKGFLRPRRVKEQRLYECLSPTHFWQIHAHKEDPEGTLIWPIIFHMYRLSDQSQVDICLHFYFQNRNRLL